MVSRATAPRSAERRSFNNGRQHLPLPPTFRTATRRTFPQRRGDAENLPKADRLYALQGRAGAPTMQRMQMSPSPCRRASSCATPHNYCRLIFAIRTARGVSLNNAGQRRDGVTQGVTACVRDRTRWTRRSASATDPPTAAHRTATARSAHRDKTSDDRITTPNSWVRKRARVRGSRWRGAGRAAQHCVEEPPLPRAGDRIGVMYERERTRGRA